MFANKARTKTEVMFFQLLAVGVVTAKFTEKGIYFTIGNEELHKTHPPIATVIKIIGRRYICCLLATSVDLISLPNFINLNSFRTKFLILIPNNPIPPWYLIGKVLFQ